MVPTLLHTSKSAVCTASLVHEPPTAGKASRSSTASHGKVMRHVHASALWCISRVMGCRRRVETLRLSPVMSALDPACISTLKEPEPGQPVMITRPGPSLYTDAVIIRPVNRSDLRHIWIAARQWEAEGHRSSSPMQSQRPAKRLRVTEGVTVNVATCTEA